MAAPTDADQGQASSLRHRLEVARRLGVWLLREQIALAPWRSLAIAVQQLLGALGTVSAFYAILVFVRAAGESRDVVIQGVRLGASGEAWTAIEFLGLFFVVVGGSAAMLYRAERMATQIALEFADHLRDDLIDDALSLEYRTWQLRSKGNPAKRLYRVAVSDIREVSIAARMFVLLLAPATMFVACSVVLLAVAPFLVLVLSPIGVVYGWWLVRVARTMHSLNLGLDGSVGATRSDFDDLATKALDQVTLGQPDDAFRVDLDAARSDDRGIHERILTPLQMKAINQALFALSTGALITVGLLRDMEVSTIILVIAALRFLVHAIEQGTARVIAAVRRSTSILAYLELRRLLDRSRLATDDDGPADGGITTDTERTTTADLPDPLGELPSRFLDKLPDGGLLLVITNRKLNQRSVRTILRAIDESRTDRLPWLGRLVTDHRLDRRPDDPEPSCIVLRGDSDLERIVDNARGLTVAFLRNPQALHRPETRRHLVRFDAAVVVNSAGVQAAGEPGRLISRPAIVADRLRQGNAAAVRPRS